MDRKIPWATVGYLIKVDLPANRMDFELQLLKGAFGIDLSRDPGTPILRPPELLIQAYSIFINSNRIYLLYESCAARGKPSTKLPREDL